jgi:hypothetical protein
LVTSGRRLSAAGLRLLIPGQAIGLEEVLLDRPLQKADAADVHTGELGVGPAAFRRPRTAAPKSSPHLLRLRLAAQVNGKAAGPAGNAPLLELRRAAAAVVADHVLRLQQLPCTPVPHRPRVTEDDLVDLHDDRATDSTGRLNLELDVATLHEVLNLHQGKVLRAP